MQEEMLLELTKEEALVFNAVGAVFTHLTPIILVKVQKEFEQEGVNFAGNYLTLIQKFEHHLHDMGWCPRSSTECPYPERHTNG